MAGALRSYRGLRVPLGPAHPGSTAVDLGTDIDAGDGNVALPEGLVMAGGRGRWDNANSMPLLGLGLSHQGGYSDAAVSRAIECGVRLFDTAQRYGSEAGLGRAVARSGVDRDDFFITTKVWPGNYHRVPASVQDSLAALQTDRIDLLLLHWPGHELGAAGRASAWAELESLQADGTARFIGVSNFLPEHLDALCLSSNTRPQVNQVEFNPFQQSHEVVAACRRLGAVFGGYCPLAKAEGLAHATVCRIATARGRTPAQVLISWSLSKGVPTIPKSVRPDRVAENAAAVDLVLCPAEIAALDRLHCDLRVTWDPAGVP